MYYNIKDDGVPMAAEPPAVFPAESRLIHAGTGRSPGLPAAPPLAPAGIYVSPGSPQPGRGYGRDGNTSPLLRVAGLIRLGALAAAAGAPMAVGDTIDKSTAELARRQLSRGAGPLLSFETDIGQALEVP
jgi:hypothetical protein